MSALDIFTEVVSRCVEDCSGTCFISRWFNVVGPTPPPISVDGSTIRFYAHRPMVFPPAHPSRTVSKSINVFFMVSSQLWKKRACRGPATITRLPSLFINQFFHNIKLLQPYDVCRHQPEPFYGPDCYICEH